MSAEANKRLQTFLKRLAHIATPQPAPAQLTHTTDPVLAELVRSFFVWERGTQVGERWLAEAHQQLVDYNELRVCLPHEFERMVSSDDPHAGSRFLRLRSVLNDIFRREHEISLSHLTTLAKRDARAYLDSLDGMHPFVSGRVCLLVLGAHAMPIDARLCTRLALEKAMPEEIDATSTTAHADAASWLEHHVLADDARETYLRIEQWADDQTGPSPRQRPKPSSGGKTGSKTAPKPRSKPAPDSPKPRKRSTA